MYTNTQLKAKHFFEMSCSVFKNSKLFKGNPPSHSLECNKVFIICQAYYKKEYKKSPMEEIERKPPSDLLFTQPNPVKEKYQGKQKQKTLVYY